MDTMEEDGQLETREHLDQMEGADDTVANPTGSVHDDVKADLCSRMIARVSQSDAHFKHQQRSEPDLTLEQKADIAGAILEKDPAMFLSRFGQFLAIEDIAYFSDLKGDYIIDFYLKEIMKQQDTVHNEKVIKNRRFAAMKELMVQGDYFSDEEMKWRNPLLYEQMVGQFLSEEEIQSKVDKTDLRFSNILLKHIDQIQENAVYAMQREQEECQEEEEEEESDAEQEMEDDPVDNDDHDDSEDKPKLPEVEKQMLRAEFLQIMQECFMSGKDKEFDYSSVDKNTYYDSLDTLEKDEEEKYFDEEEPCMVDSPQPGGDIPRSGADNPDTTADQSDASHIVDYMKYEPLPDVGEATSELTKMSVNGQIACDVNTAASDLKNLCVNGTVGGEEPG